MAYILLNALRQQVLHQTELANARVETLRIRLLKVGTLIRISVQRVHFALHSTFASQVRHRDPKTPQTLEASPPKPSKPPSSAP